MKQTETRLRLAPLLNELNAEQTNALGGPKQAPVIVCRASLTDCRLGATRFKISELESASDKGKSEITALMALGSGAAGGGKLAAGNAFKLASNYGNFRHVI